MDPREVALIERLLPENDELRRLWQQHRTFEEELNRLRGHRFLTPEEEHRRKEIQKAKLAGRDRIQAILSARPALGRTAFQPGAKEHS